jgi:hypothetical protein
MRLSAGLLHSSRDLLALLSREALTSEQVAESFHRVGVLPVEEVLEICTRCGWVVVAGAGVLLPSGAGKSLLSEDDYRRAMRVQIRDFIASYQPPWAKLIPRGRRELLIDDEVGQCLREGQLLSETYDDEIIDWWDDLAAATRGQRFDLSTQIGRRGERLSIGYEHRRVGKAPLWQAVDSNLAGFDILSRVSRADSSPLRIEVKASEVPLNDATLHLSRAEWEVAQGAGQHVFHVWSLISHPPMLAVVGKEEMAPNIPSDRGRGVWERVEIPYSVFIDEFSAIGEEPDAPGI